MKSNFERFTDPSMPEKSDKPAIPASKAWTDMANQICESALKHAKAQLHPLLRETELDRLNERDEFVKAFKFTLEQRIARSLAMLQPAVQAVFQYDETRMGTIQTWDGSLFICL